MPSVASGSVLKLLLCRECNGFWSLSKQAGPGAGGCNEDKSTMLLNKTTQATQLCTLSLEKTWQHGYVEGSYSPGQGPSLEANMFVE